MARGNKGRPNLPGRSRLIVIELPSRWPGRNRFAARRPESAIAPRARSGHVLSTPTLPFGFAPHFGR